MATVRITDDIRSHVNSQIGAMFAKRCEAAMAKLQHLDIADQVFRSEVSAKEIELAKQLNASSDGKWIPELSTLNVRIEYKDLNGNTKAIQVTVPFKPPCAVPSRFLHGTYFQQGAPRKVKEKLACYEHCVAILHEVEQINTEMVKLQASIRKVLTQCGTLRQVLEVWPSAMEYMSENVRKRHAELVIKRGATQIDEVDNEAMALLLKARMLNN